MEYRPVSGITPDTNTFVTGFTYDNANTFTILQNDGSSFSESFNVVTGLTVNGIISATTISGGTFFGDGSNLTGISTQDTFVTGGTYDNIETITFTNNTGGTFNVTGITDNDTFVFSGNADASTSTLSFLNTTGGTFTVTNSAALFADNDINVTGGTYNPSNGCVTFTTNSGTTFDVCGFLTGFTDTFTTGSTYDNGTALVT